MSRSESTAPPASAHTSDIESPPSPQLDPPPLPQASSSSVSLVGRNLPRGATLRKTSQTVAEKKTAGDDDVTMKDVEKEFDPDSIQDYDEDERENRGKTRESVRKQKSKKD
ncbi:uncharacterized protein C8Q71DRAFT_721903 [Rhodofomes roseus]|uniref:Uncharacterized protein n=1 Tax=Rhodofomes roseus TaxID=34475 RepID=A0ABQ8KPT6_9APHY|nr:uncharacterized protein C8Q71DRAFT_721903 [Rhodofomes roseus]KAH9840178.1 hypothetical protein C8Q71DRAFT_721903 [Rhodofomes roseus]